MYERASPHNGLLNAEYKALIMRLGKMPLTQSFSDKMTVTPKAKDNIHKIIFKICNFVAN